MQNLFSPTPFRSPLFPRRFRCPRGHRRKTLYMMSFFCTVAALLLILGMPQITHASVLASSTGYGTMTQDSSSTQCTDLKYWPLIDSDGVAQKTVVKGFSPPLEKWLPGHRGVDIALPRSGPVHVVAPARGVITFSGKVAGKSDLSMKTEEGIIFSFEPASSELSAGTEVKAGERIGKVGGKSDHCNDSCVHWGARRNGVYVDPLLALSPLRIILKPL